MTVSSARSAPIEKVDVLLVTTFKEEFAAARKAGLGARSDGPGVRDWEERDADGPAPFLWGRYRTADGRWLSVALMRQAPMGGSTAGLATLVARLRPTCVAMCGVCAGNPAVTAAGDVVVADPVIAAETSGSIQLDAPGHVTGFQLRREWARAARDMDPKVLATYGSADDDTATHWLLDQLRLGQDPRSHPARGRYFPGETWRSLLERTQADGLITRRADESIALTAAGEDFLRRRRHRDPQRLPFQVLVAPMVTSNILVTDADFWSRAQQLEARQAAALDVEAATVATVAQAQQVPSWLVVKGVMDHAGTQKEDRYLSFAAKASAEVLFALLATSRLPSADKARADSDASGRHSGGTFEKVASVGLADGRAHKDRLDRENMVDVLYTLVTDRGDARAGEAAEPSAAEPQVPDLGTSLEGPAVIAVQGPWGAGKTSLMHLIHQKLAVAPRRDLETSLSVRDAAALLAEPPADTDGAEVPTRTWVRVWFNPWAHQSGEQVWAGLAQTIIHELDASLHASTKDAETFWLTRNAKRLDARAIRRSLLLRSVSPALKLAVWAILVPLLARLADPTNEFTVGGHVLLNAATFALILPLVLFLLGACQTAWRYCRAPASMFLAADLLRGPVLSGAHAETTQPTPELRDPLYHARSGYLYLYQHDIKELLADAGRAGYRLIVFIDDLDRCSPQTTADVLSAVNLFLSEEFSNARFIIGLDPAVVAAHVKKGFSDTDGNASVVYGDDPHAGWTFLRKLVQLPVELPHIDDASLDTLLLHSLGEIKSSAPPPRSESQDSPAPGPTGRPTSDPRDTGPQPGSTDPGGAAGRAGGPTVSSTAFLEHSPRVRNLLTERLREQPERSVRETKRLVTIWVYYVRLLAERKRMTTDTAEEQACQLLFLAEIAARWPALQRRLHRRVDGVTGVALLIGAAADEEKWARALLRLGLNTTEHSRACRSLRSLMTKYDLRPLADLSPWLS